MDIAYICVGKQGSAVSSKASNEMLCSLDALDFTEKWLEDTVRSLRETDGSTAASSDPPAPLSAVNVHNKAYIRLLKWDHASEPFPEVRMKSVMSPSWLYRCLIH